MLVRNPPLSINFILKIQNRESIHFTYIIKSCLLPYDYLTVAYLRKSNSYLDGCCYGVAIMTKSSSEGRVLNDFFLSEP